MNKTTFFILSIVVICSLFFGYHASELRFDSDELGTNLIRSEDYQDYQKLAAPFETINQGEILYLESPTTWLQFEKLSWLDSLTRSIPNAQSLVTLEYPNHKGFTIQKNVF